MRLLLTIAILMIVAPPSNRAHDMHEISDEARITIASTSTVIYANTTDARARKVLVRNPSSVSVYVCTCTVTTADGFEIAAGDAASFIANPGETLNGVVATGTQVVHRSVGVF